jgi:type II secretory pathway pseudopilin PulG
MRNGELVKKPILRSCPRSLAGSAGFTYLSLIILVAVIALITASTVKLGAVLQRGKSEQELLNIGAAFSDALKSYADATPPGQPSYPPSLNELLKDPRFPSTRRHLRKIFVDPMTGKAEWGITYVADKVGVVAIYSLSNAKPVKLGNFPRQFVGFAGKNYISEWKFTMDNGTVRTIESDGMQAPGGQDVALPQQNSLNPLSSSSSVPKSITESSPQEEETPQKPLSPSEQDLVEGEKTPAPDPVKL